MMPTESRYEREDDMTLKLYWSPDSANLVVRIALELLEMPFEPVRLDRGAGDHKTAEYLTRNPQGLVPVLEDGEIVLFETGAILWHLMERAGRIGPDGPAMSDQAARAAALKWMFYLSNTVHADLRCAFYSNRYVPEEMVPTFRDGVRSRMKQHGDLMESQIGQGGLVGPSITVPDVYLCVCLRWAQIYPEAVMLDGLGAWPRIAALAGRIEASPGARRAFEAEFIPPDGALTAPRIPDLPRGEVTGVI